MMLQTCFKSAGTQLIRLTWPANLTMLLYTGNLNADLSLNPLKKLYNLRIERGRWYYIKKSLWN